MRFQREVEFHNESQHISPPTDSLSLFLRTQAPPITHNVCRDFHKTFFSKTQVLCCNVVFLVTPPPPNMYNKLIIPANATLAEFSEFSAQRPPNGLSTVSSSSSLVSKATWQSRCSSSVEVVVVTVCLAPPTLLKVSSQSDGWRRLIDWLRRENDIIIFGILPFGSNEALASVFVSLKLITFGGWEITFSFVCSS